MLLRSQPYRRAFTKWKVVLLMGSLLTVNTWADTPTACTGASGSTLVTTTSDSISTPYTPGDDGSDATEPPAIDCDQLLFAPFVSLQFVGDSTNTNQDAPFISFTSSANYTASTLSDLAKPFAVINAGALFGQASTQALVQNSSPYTVSMLNSATGIMMTSNGRLWQGSDSRGNTIFQNDGFMSTNVLTAANIAPVWYSAGRNHFVNNGVICSTLSNQECESAPNNLKQDVLQLAGASTLLNRGVITGPGVGSNKRAVIIGDGQTTSTLINHGMITGEWVVDPNKATIVNGPEGVIGSGAETTWLVKSSQGTTPFTWANFGHAYTRNNGVMAIGFTSEQLSSPSTILLQRNAFMQGVVDTSLYVLYAANSAVYNKTNNNLVAEVIPITQTITDLGNTAVRTSTYGTPYVDLEIMPGNAGVAVDNGPALILDTPMSVVTNQGLLQSGDAAAITTESAHHSVIDNQNTLRGNNQTVNLSASQYMQLHNRGTIAATNIAVEAEQAQDFRLRNSPNTYGAASTIHANEIGVHARNASSVVVTNENQAQITAKRVPISFEGCQDCTLENRGLIQANNIDTIFALNAQNIKITNAQNGYMWAENYVLRLSEPGFTSDSVTVYNAGKMVTEYNYTVFAESIQNLTLENALAAEIGTQYKNAISMDKAESSSVLNKGSLYAGDRTIGIAGSKHVQVTNATTGSISATGTSAVFAAGVEQALIENAGLITAKMGPAVDVSSSSVVANPNPIAEVINRPTGIIRADTLGAVAANDTLRAVIDNQAGAVLLGQSLGVSALRSKDFTLHNRGDITVSDSGAVVLSKSTNAKILQNGTITAQKGTAIQADQSIGAELIQFGQVNSPQGIAVNSTQAQNFVLMNTGTIGAQYAAVDTSGVVGAANVTNFGEIVSSQGVASLNPTWLTNTGSILGANSAVETPGGSTVVIAGNIGATTAGGLSLNSRGADKIVLYPGAVVSSPMFSSVSTTEVYQSSSNLVTIPSDGLFVDSSRYQDSAIMLNSKTASLDATWVQNNYDATSTAPLLTIGAGGVDGNPNADYPFVSTEVAMNWDGQYVTTYYGLCANGEQCNQPAITTASGLSNKPGQAFFFGGSVSSVGASQTVSFSAMQDSIVKIANFDSESTARPAIKTDQVEALVLSDNSNLRLTVTQTDIEALGTNFTRGTGGMQEATTYAVPAQNTHNSMVTMDDVSIANWYVASDESNSNQASDPSRGGVGLSLSGSENIFMQVSDANFFGTQTALDLSQANTGELAVNNSQITSFFPVMSNISTLCQDASSPCTLVSNEAINLDNAEKVTLTMDAASTVTGWISAQNSKDTQVAMAGTWTRGNPSGQDLPDALGHQATADQTTTIPALYDGSCSSDTATQDNNHLTLLEGAYLNAGKSDYVINMLSCSGCSVTNYGSIRADNGSQENQGNVFYGEALVQVSSHSTVDQEGFMAGHNAIKVIGDNTTVILGANSSFIPSLDTTPLVDAQGVNNTVIDRRASLAAGYVFAQDKPSGSPILMKNGTFVQARSGVLADVVGINNRLEIEGGVENSLVRVGQGHPFSAVVAKDSGQMQQSVVTITGSFEGESFYLPTGSDNTLTVKDAKIRGNLDTGPSFSSLVLSNGHWDNNMTIGSSNAEIVVGGDVSIQGDLRIDGDNNIVVFEQSNSQAFAHIIGNLQAQGTNNTLQLSSEGLDYVSISTVGSAQPWQLIDTQDRPWVVSFEQACMGLYDPQCQPKIIGANVIDTRSQQLGQKNLRITRTLETYPTGWVQNIDYQDRNAQSDGQPHYNNSILSLAKTWQRGNKKKTVMLEQNLMHIDTSQDIYETSLFMASTQPVSARTHKKMLVGLSYNLQQRNTLDDTYADVDYYNAFWSAVGSVAIGRDVYQSHGMIITVGGGLMASFTPEYSTPDYSYNNNMTVVLQPRLSWSHRGSMAGMQVSDNFTYQLNNTVTESHIDFEVRGVTQTHTLSSTVENTAAYTLAIQKGHSGAHLSASYSDLSLGTVGIGMQWRG